MNNPLDVHVGAYERNNIYDFDNAVMLNWYSKRITGLTDSGSSVLELGLGHGYSAEIFSKHFARYVVLEGSPAVVANFNKNYPGHNACIVETYFENFETRDRFDVIVIGFVLEHVENPAEILSRFRQFLAPRGRMFIAVPNAEVLNRRLGHLAGMLPDMCALSENDLLLGHRRYYTVKTLAEELQGAGYEIERLEGIYLKPLTAQQMASLKLGNNIIEALCRLGMDYPELSCGILAQVKDAV